MPRSFEELADTLGLEPAAILCERLGGETITVPHRADGLARYNATAARLVDTIGDTAAAELIEAHRGEQLYIPLARPQVAPLLHARGAGIAEIARRLKTTRTNVRRILRRANG